MQKYQNKTTKSETWPPKNQTIHDQRKTGPVNYQLRLPELMKHLHPVFHILLLEPAPQNAQTVENIKIKDNDEYEVERILKHKWVNGWPLYLIKWKGYDTSENTWEPIANLKGCHQAMQEYQQQKGHSKKKEIYDSTPPTSD